MSLEDLVSHTTLYIVGVICTLVLRYISFLNLGKPNFPVLLSDHFAYFN